MLEVRDINTFYGKIQALWGVSLRINDKEIVALVGSNGAGKTTLLNTISGLLHPASGTVVFLGTRIDNLAPHAIVELGMSHIPEGRKLFPDMSVRENLEMGAFTRDDADGIAQDMEFVFNLFPRLRERASQLGGTLSGGEQQMLAIGRAVMARPEMILLDEPSMGLSPLLVKEVFGIIRNINQQQGITMLLVEQNANMALQIAHFGYVMENVKIVLEGNAADLRENPDVKEFYLGIAATGTIKTYKDVKSYKRRKRWL